MSAPNCLFFLNNNKTENNSENPGENTNENTNNDNEQEDNPSVSPTTKYKIKEPDFSHATRNNIEEVTFDDLFNLNNRVEIIIDVDKSEMQKINDDNVYGGDFSSIKPETYHLAKKFTLNLYNGDKKFTWELENVGIRQKGNTSRGRILDGNRINLRHYKLSFEETFDDEYTETPKTWTSEDAKSVREDRDFFGADKIDIRWNSEL